MHTVFRSFIISALLCSSTLAFAFKPTYTINGTEPRYIEYTKPIEVLKNGESTLSYGHTVQLLHVDLSKATKDYIAKHITDTYTPSSSIAAAALPSAVNLGMNQVPVYNQGDHNTCVMFAASAAVDALLGHTEYVSKVCSLALGKYIHNLTPQFLDPWEGSRSESILDLFTKYGIHSLANQETYGCGGLKTYPTNSSKTGQPMSPAEFATRSEDVMKNIAWGDATIRTNSNENLNLAEKIKAQLAAGHRVIIGFLIAGRSNGAIGTYRTGHDSWIVTRETIKSAQMSDITTAHEVVIIGYDDNGVIRGPKCEFQRGLFITRNSWGKNAGNKGEFYMSYDYLMTLLSDAYYLESV